MYHGFGGNFLGMGLGWFLPLLLLVFVAWLAVKAARQNGGTTAERGRDRSALDILEERYARGEIDEREFQERKRVLRG